MKIAAIMTCHNRKNKTMACLKSLFTIIPETDVYLTDDGSTDGTSEAVLDTYPNVHIISGDGNLYWNRGMYVAWKEAQKMKYDYYLWLNDDVVLYPTFFQELMECNHVSGGHCVIVGLIKDFSTGEIIYGGTDKKGKLIQETNSCQHIANMNGNVVLVPQSVVEEIGIIDPVYWHDIGDVDYGLMAQKAGIPVLSTRIAVADGHSNGKFCRVRKWDSTFSKRFKKLYSPLGSNPYISFYFFKKHKGLIPACLIYLYLHMINLMPDWMVKLVWNDKFVEVK